MKVKDLPYNFELNETMRMAMGAETLANTKIVVVGATHLQDRQFHAAAG